MRYYKSKFLAKISCLSLCLLVGSSLGYTVSAEAVDEFNIEEVKDRIKDFSEQEQEQLLLQAIEKQLILDTVDEVFNSYEEFENMTTVYSDKNGKIVIGFKKDSINKEKIKVFKKIIKEKDTNKKIKFKMVKNSTTDLQKISDELISELTLSHPSIFEKTFSTEIDFEKNYIVIIGENLSTEEMDIIKETIEASNHVSKGAIKKVTTKPQEITNNSNYNEDSVEDSNVLIKSISEYEMPQPEISRNRNWTKLGGGIYIKDSGATPCSTAGVAKKGSNYFLLTAGHCLNADSSLVYQSDAAVGRDHSTGVWAQIDVGLIRVTNDNTIAERRASNKFFKNAHNLDDYDASISGVSVVWQNDTVCKSGLATGVTCGYVSSTSTKYTSSKTGSTYSVAKVQPNLNHIDYSYPGDSGSITYDPVTHALVGIHSGGGANNGYFAKITDVINLYSTSSEKFTIYTSSLTPVIAK